MLQAILKPWIARITVMAAIPTAETIDTKPMITFATCVPIADASKVSAITMAGVKIPAAKAAFTAYFFNDVHRFFSFFDI
ncbi:hypothetical protein NX90_11145 [Neisseria meningitidis]|nr:hypothetical protein NX90_11145 [Neisseria meningitidis]